jgi:hypothetical protein
MTTERHASSAWRGGPIRKTRYTSSRVAIPKTFSAPGEAYEPSIADAVRYAVWLMLVADNVNRRAYMYDENDEARGVRIFQTQPEFDISTGRVTTPQQVVGNAISQASWKYATNNAGEIRITIGVAHIGAADSDFLSNDVNAPSITPETRLARVHEILMRGTLWREDQIEEDAKRSRLVDPYRSPLDGEGLYEEGSITFLSTMAPDIRYSAKQTYPNPRERLQSEADIYKLDPIRDFAVSYGLFATYTVDVRNRANQRHGG